MTDRTGFVDLCRRMADHTRSCCLETCRHLGACCSPEVCETTCHEASAWGLDLLPEENGLLIDEDGLCKAPPHVRLLCTVHQCEIANFGAWKDHDVWTGLYYELRDAIAEKATKVGDLDPDPEGVLDDYRRPR